jgi:molecular chaperone DnaK
MGSYIGIDLGTTFSAVAAIDETGRPQIIRNSDGENLTPSCVMEEDDVVVVGEIARKTWGVDQGLAAARFKREMDTSRTYDVNGNEFTPTELSALVLKKLKQDAESEVGEIAEAVVTIPANFSNKSREATMEAAKIAGLTVNYIINEPTAAALYYAFKSGDELRGNYAVFDLGGGTFDVSIIKVNGQQVDAIASCGVNRLGGDDFDKAIFDLVAKKYKEQTGKTLDVEDYPLNDAEEDKKSLSKRKRVLAKVGREAIEIKREEFEDAISSLIAQTVLQCESVLDESNLTPSEIDGVFLAGGSTRLPIVIENVEKVFKQEPISTVNVDEVVALGAALYAAFKSDKKHLSPTQKSSIDQIKITETTAKCFGTQAVIYNSTKDNEELTNKILIKKNEKIPCSVKETFFTMHEGQDRVDCTVTESTSAETDLRFVTKIWEGQLDLPSDRPKNQKIEITYSFDENQIMHCEFLDVESGRKEKVDLTVSSSSDESGTDIDQFLVE